MLRIKRRPISADAAAVQSVAAPCHRVRRVALDGVDNASLHILYYSHMVRNAVCAPVEEDDVAGDGDVDCAILIQLALREPAYSL